MLLDQEHRLGASITRSPLVVNVVSAESTNRNDKKKTLLIWQICTKKGHSTLNYYNCFILIHRGFRQPTLITGHLPHLLRRSFAMTSDRVILWFPDLGATNHIMPDSNYITSSMILTADGVRCKSLVYVQRNNLKLNDILLVPSANKNLLSVHKLCQDNN